MSIGRYVEAKVEPLKETRVQGFWKPMIQTMYRIWYYKQDDSYHYADWWCDSDEEAAAVAKYEMKRKNLILEDEEARQARIKIVTA